MATRIIVFHSGYGCDTGCCGHYVVMETDDKPAQQSRFDFSHPYGEDPRKFAEDLVRDEFGEEHVKDLDWDNCTVSEE